MGRQLLSLNCAERTVVVSRARAHVPTPIAPAGARLFVFDFIRLFVGFRPEIDGPHLAHADRPRVVVPYPRATRVAPVVIPAIGDVIAPRLVECRSPVEYAALSQSANRRR